MHARVLGYLLLFAPTIQAEVCVARAIDSCNENPEQLASTSDFLLTSFIDVFRFKKYEDPCLSDWEPATDTKKDDRTEIQALTRDGYKCMITGIYGRDAYTYGVPRDLVKQTGRTLTRCTHIVPSPEFYTSVSDFRGLDKDEYATLVLAALRAFGYPVEALRGSGVHSLFNVMTLEVNMDDFFGRLELWLEPTDVPHSYDIMFYLEECRSLIKGKKTVTFTSSDPDRLPLLSPTLIALHAMCAKVVRLSDAAAYLELDTSFPKVALSERWKRKFPTRAESNIPRFASPYDVGIGA
ncbi:hypothetical protein ONZ45_g18601 [Pleurotus djamor]|nr:hypothetical protein ONZ45_g18601 [Pleurotus djamor]